MNIPKYNNAAGRLYEVFRALHAINDGVPTVDAWWSVLGLGHRMAPGTGPVQRLFLGHQLSLLAKQLDDVERHVKLTFQDHLDIYGTQFDSLRHVLSPTSLENNIGHYKQWLTAAALTDLGHCAKDLPKEDHIGKEETTRLYEEIQSLKQLIEQSSLEVRLKEWLTELAEEMQKALDEYELCGGKAFEKAWSLLVGNFVLRHDDLERAKAEAPQVVTKAVAITDKINAFAKRSALHALAIFVIGSMAVGGIQHVGELVVEPVFNAALGYAKNSMTSKPPTRSFEADAVNQQSE